jgi:hypothetical protein
MPGITAVILIAGISWAATANLRAQSKVNAIPTVAIPDPPPKTSPTPAAAQARATSMPAPDPAATAIKNIKVINFTSQRYSSQSVIADGRPDQLWHSSDGTFPQSFVLELPTESVVSYLIVNNQSSSDPMTPTKDIEISMSSQGQAFGFGAPMKAVLERGEIGQGVELRPQMRGRWMKLRILSNYGAKDSTTLGLVQVVGKSVAP